MKITNKNLEKVKGKTDNGLKLRVLNDLEDFETSSERQIYLQDVLQHGCQSGMVPGLIYYSDTNSFYDKYEAEIWQLLEDRSEDMGTGIVEMIASFNGADSVIDQMTFKNLLAWFAYEETAREVLEVDFEIEF